jgi:hypothetical protein
VDGKIMTENDANNVRERAYKIWEDTGRPDGEHLSHWRQALAELGLASPSEQPDGTTLSKQQLEAEFSGVQRSVETKNLKRGARKMT